MLLGGNCGKQDVIPVCMHACVTCSVVAAALCWLHYSLNLLCKKHTPSQLRINNWDSPGISPESRVIIPTAAVESFQFFLAANGVMQDNHTAVLLNQYTKRTICATEEP